MFFPLPRIPSSMAPWTGPVITFGRMRIQTDGRVYGPDDDTFLLDRCARVRKGERVLEVGCGTGFVSISKALEGANVTAVDIDPVAVELTGHNAAVNGCEVAVSRSDLFSEVEGRFDAVLFNPPYLPTSPNDLTGSGLDAAVGGGRRGDEVVLRFLDGLGSHLASRGRAYLLLSSLTPRRRILEGLEGRFRRSVAGASDAGMERLEVWSLEPRRAGTL